MCVLEGHMCVVEERMKVLEATMKVVEGNLFIELERVMVEERNEDIPRKTMLWKMRQYEKEYKTFD